jgi:hypothetical protein
MDGANKKLQEQFLTTQSVGAVSARRVSTMDGANKKLQEQFLTTQSVSAVLARRVSTMDGANKKTHPIKGAQIRQQQTLSRSTLLFGCLSA